MTFVKTFVFFLVLIVSAQSSYLKELGEVPVEVTETVETSKTEVVDEPSTELLPSDDPNSYTNSPLDQDETAEAMVLPGKLFRLKMTVVEDWQHEYTDNGSATFKKLTDGLGSQLMDFIDNSKESSEPNMTIFQLVEVLPVKDSLKKIYVTFIVSSEKEVEGEGIKTELENQINIYGEIYEYNATIEGFVFETVTKEEAESYGSIVICEDFSPSTANVTEKSNPPIDHPIAEKTPKCSGEKIERGFTSIFVFENKPECIEQVMSDNSLPRAEVDSAENHDEHCGKKSSKRSVTSDDDDGDEETVIVVRKKGGKVFIEI